MALVDLAALAMRVVRVEGGILEAAGRVDVAGLADVFQQHFVAGAPVETVGFLGRAGRAVGRAGLAAGRVVDDAPGPEAVVALVGAQDAEPVDQHADALLEGVGVEAVVAGGGLEPDQAADAFRLAEPLAAAGLEIGGVLIDHGSFGERPVRRRGGGDRGIFGMGIGDAVVLNLEYTDASSKGDDCRKSGQQSTFHTFSPPIDADGFRPARKRKLFL